MKSLLHAPPRLLIELALYALFALVVQVLAHLAR